MSSALLAFGLVLTAATQFRLAGLPLGPGELLLAVWIGLETFRRVLYQPLVPNPAFRRVAVFWVAMVAMLCAGMMVGLAVEPFHYLSGMLRDAIAYLLVLAFSLLVALSFQDPQARQRILWLLLVMGSASLTLQIAGAYGLLPIPGIRSWFFDRLIGWAENPNQLGFFALTVVLLGLHVFQSAKSAFQHAWAAALSVPPLFAGIMSKSDSLIIGLILSGALIATLQAIVWVRNEKNAPTLRGTATVMAVMALPLAITATVPFASAAFEKFEQSSEAIYGENEQGDARLKLWTEALDKGIESKLIGFGPGPHLTSKSYKRPPPYKFEAHNTLLDLFTQGGIVAMSAFVWLTGTAFIGVSRAGKSALAGIVVGVLVFGIFHYIVRHPIFWFFIVVCLLESDLDKRPGLAGGRPQEKPSSA